MLSPTLWWLAPLCAAAYTVGNIGGVGAWLTGPARVAFTIGLDRYFPPELLNWLGSEIEYLREVNRGI